MFTTDTYHLWAALTGSMLQEIFWWYGRRLSPVIRAHLGGYLIITTLFIAASTLGTIFLLAGEAASPRTHLLTAFGFPIIIKRAFKMWSDEQSRKAQKTAGVVPPREFVRSYVD